MLYLLLFLALHPSSSAADLPLCSNIQISQSLPSGTRLWLWSAGERLAETPDKISYIKDSGLLPLLAKSTNEELLSIIDLSASRSFFIFSAPKGFRVIGYDKTTKSSFFDQSKMIYQKISSTPPKSVYTPLVDALVTPDQIYFLSSFHMATLKRSDLDKSDFNLQWQELPLLGNNDKSRAVALWSWETIPSKVFLLTNKLKPNSKPTIAYEYGEAQRWQAVSGLPNDVWKAYSAIDSGIRMHKSFNSILVGDNEYRALSFGKTLSQYHLSVAFPNAVWRAQLLYQAVSDTFTGLISHENYAVYYKRNIPNCYLQELREIVADDLPNKGISYMGITANNELLQIKF